MKSTLTGPLSSPGSMSYQNPKIPEGINVTDEHPLKDFFAMLLGIGLLVALFFLTLSFIAEKLVVYIPFETEVILAERMSGIPDEDSEPHQLRVESYLQTLADQLAISQQLPENMPIKIHYVKSETVNAHATLGGHIVIYRGLLEKMPDENTLAMVVAHEIAHIKNRDPIIALGRGLTVGLAMLSIFGAGDSGLSDQLVSHIGQLTILSFSREQESLADELALNTLAKHYGHTGGAETLFNIFKDEEKIKIPGFLRTHPVNESRLNAVKAFSRKQGNTQRYENKLIPAWVLEDCDPVKEIDEKEPAHE